MDNNIKPSPDLKEAKRHFSRIGVAATVMLLLMIAVAQIIYSLAYTHAPDIAQKEWFSWAVSSVTMYIIAMPAFLIIMQRIPSTKPKKSDMGGRRWFVLIAVSATVMYLGSYASNVLMSIIAGFTGIMPENTVTQTLVNSNPIIRLALVGIVAPVLEELIFRKALLDRTRVYGEKTALIFSALVFALFHGNFYQFFYAFGLGIVLGYVYLRTGRIRNTIFLHMGINLLNGVLMSWLIQKLTVVLPEELLNSSGIQEILSNFTGDRIEELSEALAPALPYMAIMSVYSMALFALSIIGFVLMISKRKKIRLERAERELPREAVGGVVYMNAGIVALITVCAVVMVLSLM